MNSDLNSKSTIRQALSEITQALSLRVDLVERGVVLSEAEQILFGAFREVTGQELSRFSFYSQTDAVISVDVFKRALSFAQRRVQGELLQYILGYQFFFEHEYGVSPQVLVPRPETEVLLAIAIERLNQLNLSRPWVGIEIGLGSGILSIELLSRFDRLTMIATELSPGAIEIAKKNAVQVLGDQAQRLSILSVSESKDVCDTLAMKGVRADFLISNPPYLLKSSDEVEGEVVTHEPHEALFAPAGEPNYFYERIAQQAKGLLRENGFVFLELPHERARDIVSLFEYNGWDAQLIQDLNVRDRVCIAQYRGRRV